MLGRKRNSLVSLLPSSVDIYGKYPNPKGCVGWLVTKGSHFGGSQLEVSNLMLSIYFGFKVSLIHGFFSLFWP